MDWWQFVVVPLVGALLGFIPFGFHRFNLTRREMARLRRALDCAADFRRIARDCSDEAEHPEYGETEQRYQQLLSEYERLNGIGVKKA